MRRGTMIRSNIILFGLLLFVTACTHHKQESQDIRIKANSESLIGSIENGISIFRGVPFAKPPIGDLRWRAPRKHVPRLGDQHAKQFAPACMQDEYLTDWYRDVIASFGGDVDEAPVPRRVSEDCLYLNVWTPVTDSSANLPVMVYIYGGNNLSGWTYEPNYLGHELAKKDVVVVSIAYRQGIFGAFVNPEIADQEGEDNSGNFFLLDLIAGLNWIQENIHSFGGDPANVTVFGESAGAANIGYLSVSPLARNLFKRAIKQSGGFELHHVYANAYEEEKELGAGFAKMLGVSTLAELREKPAGEVHAQAMKYYGDSSYNAKRKNFFAIVDDHVMPDTPARMIAQGQIHLADYLIGSNADENLMYTPEKVTEKEVNQYIEDWFPAQNFMSVKDTLSFLVNRRDKMAVLDDSVDYSCPIQILARAINRHLSNKVYVYYFSRVREHDTGKYIGAYHGAELPYVFGTHDDWLPTSTDDLNLTDQIMTYWTNFARVGDPNGIGLPRWEPYGKQKKPVLNLGDKVAMREVPHKLLCDLFHDPTI